MEPETLRLPVKAEHPSSAFWLAVMLWGGAALSVVVTLGSGSYVPGSFAVGFFALFGYVAHVSRLPGRLYLELSPGGVRERTVFRNRFWRWKDLAACSVIELDGGDEGKHEVVGLRHCNRSLRPDFFCPVLPDGCDTILTDTYGMTLHALAALLNEWRLRFGDPPDLGEEPAGGGNGPPAWVSFFRGMQG
jgi:hypothetical protein